MKVQVIGIQPVEFRDRESGEEVHITKLFVVSPEEDTSGTMQGRSCDVISTRLDCSHVMVGELYDFVYERQLGSSPNSRPRLTEIAAV